MRRRGAARRVRAATSAGCTGSRGRRRVRAPAQSTLGLPQSSDSDSNSTATAACARDIHSATGAVAARADEESRLEDELHRTFKS